jgi:hypothetical protein
MAGDETRPKSKFIGFVLLPNLWIGEASPISLIDFPNSLP